MRVILLLVAILSMIPSFAQVFGNEWIDYSQRYYAFKIWEDGVYRIYQEDLVNSGVPIETVPVNRIQIFGKEKELPVYVQDNGNGVFEAGEYIEFYAEKNTGWIDSILYQNPDASANPAYSLYNDTLHYFLSWTTNTLGKRYVQETDVNYSTWPVSPYVWGKSIVSPNNFYLDGRKEAGSSSSFFVDGEGWGNGHANGVPNGASQNFSMPIPGYYTGSGAPSSIVHAKVTSNSNAAASGVNNHHLRLSFNGSLMVDTLFNGYKQIRSTKSFSSSLLTGPNAVINMSIVNDLGAATDYQAFTYGQIEYPRNLSVDGRFLKFRLEQGTTAKSRLELLNFVGTNPVGYVWGGTVPRRIPIVGSGTRYAVVPNSVNGIQHMIVVTEEAIRSVSGGFQAVNGNGFFTNYMTQNYESSVLMIYPSRLAQSATQYRDYRQSSTGGNYNVVFVNADELYLQFGGGVEKHVLGVRRFAHLAYNLSSAKPLALFLIGKGIREANEGSGSIAGARKSITSFRDNLIPSFGYPSSDICITAGLEGTHWEPLIPTGRIAANSNEEVLVYLSKVQESVLEQDPFSIYNSASKDWQKHVLHFGGGSSPGEISTIRSYLENMKVHPEREKFGGYVHTYIKESSDPFDPVLLNEVKERIDEGVSVMTFFSHAAPGGFEINIDEPDSWNNSGRYPLVIGNACYTGDIFLPNAPSASEKFVLIPEKGAIAFLSTVKLGFASYLHTYSNEFYRQFAKNSYGSGLGEQIRSTVMQVQNTIGNFIMETTCTQMTLHGDPLVKVNPHNNPEIEITEQSISFSPTELDLSVDEFELKLVVKNLGQSIIDSINVEVRRQFPGQSVDSLYREVIPRLDYIDTVVFTMPLQPNVAVGLNQFEVSVDIPSYIPEQYDEVDNNRIVRTFFIDVDGIVPVLPYDFAVVPRDSVVIKASTVNPVAEFNTYRFEIDTTDLFNSPFRKYALVSGEGGVKEVLPSEWRSSNSGSVSPLVCADSMVYFWRVALEGSDPDWRENSFQYIHDKEGWGQDHFFQFKKNTFTFLDYDRSIRQKDFETYSGTVKCDVWDNASNVTTFSETQWFINNTMIDYDMCGTSPSLHVAVLDPITLEPWYSRGIQNGQEVNSDKNFNNANDLSNSPPCRERPEGYFVFRQNSLQQLQAFENMIMNEVPDSAYVLIYSTIRADYTSWDALYPQVYNVFQALGSDSVYQGRDNRAFIFFGKKGTDVYNKEVVAQAAGELISLSAPVFGVDYFGQERSLLIGPAASWEAVYWKQDPLEVPLGDTTRLLISGLDIYGNVQSVIDTMFTRNDSIINLYNLMDASIMPYLRLEARYEDKSFLTPAQIDRWHVLYEQLPEAAIDGTNGFYWSASSDTVPEGTSLSFAVDVRNISERHMDSLLVKYWVQNQNQEIVPITYPRQDSLRIGEVLRDTITFETYGMSGLNSLWMEVNPYVMGSTVVTDQPEQFHFNNILQIPFFVSKDNINPLLDVTFDGVHILNGDIVSPKSEIVISLKDENPFLLMSQDADTSLFAVYLRHPDGVQKRIPFIDGDGRQVMDWIPASDSYNKFKIIYHGEFPVDGEYMLLVQGTDLSGNLSGDLEYRIGFEIIHESTITYLMNYPNPFSTSTKFVFTLTGDRVPDHMIIQIMTVTGKVVREITMNELGPVRIGRNITEYAWDGRDEFGDLLANGVYLYRVLTDLDGDKIKHRDSGADQFFKKEFGKMYLLR
ncbi:hypothetical protein GCM10009118_08720 [Wandonia haliotis]|uniref:Gingipain domain-containing protein n=1 Tax=Wandonia haliotis TaxID=574963 RepID=A0ABN1MME2_9FLAO